MRVLVLSRVLARSRLDNKLEREAGLGGGGLLEAGLGGVIEAVVAQAAGVHGNGVSCARVVLMWCWVWCADVVRADVAR